jgi:phytoene desaturase
MPPAKKKVIVVGAGPGGLASAMILASRGFDVEVFEKRDRVGGRNSCLEFEGFKFDVGPTFLMMKFLLDDIFVEAGARSEDYLKFQRLDPLYRLCFGDRTFTPSAEPEGTREEIERLFPGRSGGLDRFFAGERARFSRIIPCLQRDFSSLPGMLSFTLLKAFPYLGLGKSVFDVLKGYFGDEELALLFSFQSKYLGMSAWKCPGGFAMLSYIEHAFGVYHVAGGLSEISTALARAAEERGARIHVDAPVRSLLLEGKTVRGVELESGETVGCDDLVLNADFAHAMTQLVPPGALRRYSPQRIERMRFSCSTFMLYLGLDRTYPLPHHTIVFARDYRRNVEEIFERGVPSTDISFYVRNASPNDPTLAPPGKSGLYVLVPVPNLGGEVDWEDARDRYREMTLKAIEERLGVGDLRRHIVAEKVMTPVDWRDRFSVYKGATFNLAHNLGQMAYWRPRNRFEELDGCFLTGGGTHPGSGLPTILESARISANLISRKHGVRFITKELSI